MPEDFEIKPFVRSNRAEVKEMLMSEYNEEKVIRQNREEGYSDGYADGIEAAKM